MELKCVRSPFEPKFIYDCKYRTDQLLMTNLLTGEQSYHRVHNYKFQHYCRWNELPGGSLFITGGWTGFMALEEVVKNDTLREWAVSSQPPIHTARNEHAAVYHSQYLYVLGAVTGP
jgi:hypothetical protein